MIATTQLTQHIQTFTRTRDLYFPFYPPPPARGGNIILKIFGKKYDERGKNMMKGERKEGEKRRRKGEKREKNK